MSVVIMSGQIMLAKWCGQVTTLPTDWHASLNWAQVSCSMLTVSSRAVIWVQRVTQVSHFLFILTRIELSFIYKLVNNIWKSTVRLFIQKPLDRDCLLGSDILPLKIISNFSSNPFLDILLSISFQFQFSVIQKKFIHTSFSVIR